MNVRTKLITTLILSLCAWVAAAATYTRNDSNGSWTNTAQWTPSGCPNSPADDAFFSGFTGVRSISIESAVTTAYLRTDVTVVAGLTAAGTGARRLVMTNTTANPQIVLQRASRFSVDTDFPQIELLQPLDIIVSQNYARFANDFVGTADLHCYPRGGYVQFQESVATKADSPYYYGSVFCHGPRASTSYVFYYPNCLTNAAQFVLVDNGELRLAAAVSSFNVPLLVSNGVLYINGIADSTLLMTTNVTLAGVLSNTISAIGVELRNAGDVRGNGMIVLSTGSLSTNTFTGSITPGFSAGKLTLNEYNSAWRLYLGVSGDPVTLNLEVLGNGGVAGTDYDQLELQNMSENVNLANTEVHFTSLAATSATNWFLTSNTALLNDFSDVRGTNGQSIVFFGKSANGLSYGISVIPEPAALLAALLALFGIGMARHRA